MGYSEGDLDVFAILLSSENCEGTAYFELHPGDLPQPFACWLDGSIFIRDAGFDFMVDCFSRANPKFDYFAFERFDLAQIEALCLELNAFLQTLVPGCQRDELFARYKSICSRDIWIDVATEPLRVAVSRAVAGILEFVQQTHAEQKALWVLGM